MLVHLRAPAGPDDGARVGKTIAPGAGVHTVESGGAAFSVGSEALVNITLFSFGFKHGYAQADMVWDVRFLPNPYWVPELRPRTGREEEVARHALDNAAARRFFAMLEPLLLFLIEEHSARGRADLTLAVGCTGGRHRSVAVVEHLQRFLAAASLTPQVFHRDVDKE